MEGEGPGAGNAEGEEETPPSHSSTVPDSVPTAPTPSSTPAAASAAPTASTRAAAAAVAANAAVKATAAVAPPAPASLAASAPHAQAPRPPPKAKVANFFSLDAMQEDDPWMVKVPPPRSRVGSDEASDEDLGAGSVPVIPAGSGYDDSDAESDGDDIDGALLSARRGVLYSPGSMPVARGPAPAAAAAAAAAATASVGKGSAVLDESGFVELDRRRTEDAAVRAVALGSGSLLPPMGSGAGSDTGAEAAAQQRGASTAGAQGGLRYNRATMAEVAAPAGENAWQSPPPKPPPELFDPSDPVEAYRVVDLYHVAGGGVRGDGRGGFETPLPANQYLSGLRVPDSRGQSDEVAGALHDVNLRGDAHEGGKHSWLHRARQQRRGMDDGPHHPRMHPSQFPPNWSSEYGQFIAMQMAMQFAPPDERAAPWDARGGPDSWGKSVLEMMDSARGSAYQKYQHWYCTASCLTYFCNRAENTRCLALVDHIHIPASVLQVVARERSGTGGQGQDRPLRGAHAARGEATSHCGRWHSHLWEHLLGSSPCWLLVSADRLGAPPEH